MFGSNLDLSAETVHGQEIGILAQIFYEADQAIVAQSNAQSRDRAIGSQLDDFFSLKDIIRLKAERTTVTATVTGASGGTVPALSKVRTTNGDAFRTITQIIIGNNGTTTGVEFESVNTGSIPAPHGNQTIVDNSDWTNVVFNADATIGRNIEDDDVYRLRGGLIEQNNAVATVESIRTALLLTEGVKIAQVYENDKTYAIEPGDKRYKGISIDPNSTLAIVDGGSDANVASTIANKKVGGMPTSGSRSHIVSTLSGVDGSFLPAGTRAILIKGTGEKYEFRSTEDIMLPTNLADGSKGTNLCEFEAVSPDPIHIPAIPHRWDVTLIGATAGSTDVSEFISISTPAISNATTMTATLSDIRINPIGNISISDNSPITITIDGTTYTFQADGASISISAGGESEVNIRHQFSSHHSSSS